MIKSPKIYLYSKTFEKCAFMSYFFSIFFNKLKHVLMLKKKTMIFVECWLGVRGGVQIIFANVMQIFSVTLSLLPLSPSISLLPLSLSPTSLFILSLVHLTLYFLGKPDMYKAKVRLSHIVASLLYDNCLPGLNH